MYELFISWFYVSMTTICIHLLLMAKCFGYIFSCSLLIKSMFYYFCRISQVKALRNQAMHRRKGRTTRHWSQDIAGRNEEGKTLDMLEAIFWSWEYFTREQSKTDHWLDSSGWIMEIRKTRFNLLGVIYKGKGTRLFTVQGCFSILIVLFTKLSSPNLTWKNHFRSDSTKACISR